MQCIMGEEGGGGGGQAEAFVAVQGASNVLLRLELAFLLYGWSEGVGLTRRT